MIFWYIILRFKTQVKIKQLTTNDLRQTPTGAGAPLSEKEFETLYKQSYRKALYYCNQYIGDFEKSKEIVQEAFINLWEKRQSIYVESGNPEYYLLTAVRNLAFNAIRNKIRESKRTGKAICIDDKINEKSLSQEPCDLLTFNEINTVINTTVDSMSEKVREVYIMSREMEMTYPQIAEKLDISVKTVEYRLSKALALFRKTLKKYLPLIFLFFNSFFR